jgi:predicted kinase
MGPIPFPVTFSEAERRTIQSVADKYGISFEEAATGLKTGGIADRVKKRTGKLPAKVYSYQPKKP